jgi:DivIVA domain-containing protein
VRSLTQREIVDKDFDTKLRGYDREEVDEFLDLIIQDYKSFQDEIEELKEDNDRLIAELDETSKQSDMRAQSQSSGQSTVTNFDILKRLSNLERQVFGSKLDDSDVEDPNDQY